MGSNHEYFQLLLKIWKLSENWSSVSSLDPSLEVINKINATYFESLLKSGPERYNGKIDKSRKSIVDKVFGENNLYQNQMNS